LEIYNMETFEFNHTLFGLPQGSDILLVHAHPDDESMTGGVIRAAKLSGITPHIFYATNGEASTYGDPDALKSGARQLEAQRALGHYGIHDPIFGKLPDGELAENYMPQLEGAISRILGKVPVSAIITLGAIGYDWHSDHIATHNASLTAASQHAQAGGELRLFGLTRGQGTHFVPADRAQKLRVLAEHESQFEIFKPDDPMPDETIIDETGLGLHPDTHARLERYRLNHHLEVYKEFDVHDAGKLALIGAAEVGA
jgi:LmbE family N-acetylglucosaminyl deacetylase